MIITSQDSCIDCMNPLGVLRNALSAMINAQNVE